MTTGCAIGRRDVVVVFLLLGAAVAVGACVASGAQCASRRSAEQLRLSQVHAGILTASVDTQRDFPLPSLFVHDPVTHQHDERSNHHAAMWGILVLRDYIAPESLISPSEHNPCVEAVDPGALSLSDDGATGFQVDLDRRSNCSYAAMPLDPTGRRRQSCSMAGGSCVPVVGTRGPRGGWLADPQTGRVESSTVHVGADGPVWRGVIVMRDGHVEFEQLATTTPRGLLCHAPCPGGPESAGDSLFRNDDGCLQNPAEVLDFWLVVQRASPATRPDGH
jgi:hypothetical protein